MITHGGYNLWFFRSPCKIPGTAGRQSDVEVGFVYRENNGVFGTTDARSAAGLW